MGTVWNTDRRSFLKVGGGFAAAMAVSPRFAWAADGDTLRIRMGGDPQVLDPAYMIGEIEESIMRGIYTSLVKFGDLTAGSPWSKNDSVELLEQLDPKTIKFTLIPGLKWTNGFGPVTPADVKFSYERVANPQNASPWAYQFEKLDHVEVVDDRTGLIHLKEPYSPLFVTALPYYGGHIICKAATEKVGGKYTTEVPATCGPYLFTKWEPKQKVTMTANLDWPGPKPDFSTVEIYIVGDDQAAALAYEAESFDYTRVGIDEVKRLKDNPLPSTKLIEAQSTRYMWLTINIDSPRLKDPKVRQAVQNAIDVDQILIGVFNGLTTRATGIVQGGTKYSRPANLIPGNDVEKAKSLLAEAGVSDLTLSLSVMSNGTNTAIAQIIQATLEPAGIKTEIQPYDEGAYWAIGDKTKGDGYKNLDLVLMDFAGGVDPSENMVWFRPDQIGIYNWSGFNSPEFETLYHALTAKSDDTKRIVISRKMEDLMEQSGGFVFICHIPEAVIHRDTFTPVIYPDGHPNPVFFKKT